jgi:hypothetical protein
VSLPENVAIRISSEAAGGITLTPVVTREFPLWEFVEMMLVVTGKDADQIRELLARGSLVIGASRFRWVGCETEAADIASLLSRFPDPDPQRPFLSDRCVEALLHTPAGTFAVGREDALRKRWFSRRSFWDELLSVAGEPRYVEYSYRRKADVYRSQLAPAQQEFVRTAAALVVSGGLRTRLRTSAISSVEFFVVR